MTQSTRAPIRPTKYPAQTNATPDQVSVTNTVSVSGSSTVTVSNTVSVTFSGASFTGSFQASGFATSATPSYTDSTTQALSLNLAGNLRTTVSGIANTVSVTGTFFQTTQPVSLAATSSGGYTPSTSTALSSASFGVTGSAATLGGYFFYNPNSSVAYVQLFDTTSVTVGTTAPNAVLGIPATAGANIQCNIAFTASIKAAATTTPTGSTSLTSALVASFWYK